MKSIRQFSILALAALALPFCAFAQNQLITNLTVTGTQKNTVGPVGIGTAQATPATMLQVIDTGTSSPRGITNDQINNGTNSAQINLRKARGTFASPAAVVTGDLLSRVISWGYDGSNFIESGGLRFTSEGTIASTRVPSKFDIYVGTDAAPTVLTSTASFSGKDGISLTAVGTNQSITLTPSGTGSAIVNSSDTATATFVAQFLQPSQPASSGAGNGALVVWGKANTTRNSAYLSYNYTSAGSVSNFIGIGHRGLAPSVVVAGSGNLLLGGLTTDGTGVLQFPAATTSAGGIGFGTDVFQFRSGTRAITFSGAGQTVVNFNNSSNSVNFQAFVGTTTGEFGTTTNHNVVLFSNGATALTLDTSQNATFAKLITSYNGIATAGNGVVTVQGSGRSTAQTAAVGSVATYTVGASDASFEVSANVLVTTSTTHSFTATCAYTDESNVARTLTLSFSGLTGTFLTAITNVTGAGPYEGVPMHIRCKASTAITIATAGTFTTVTYNVEGNIRKLQ